MPVIAAIGLIAGFAAAVMLYSAAQGPSFAGFLLSLTSMLPIFLAGLGWGLPAAMIASLTGAGIFAFIATPAAGGIWLLSQAVPVLVLCHYAYLSRQSVGQSADQSADQSAGSTSAAAEAAPGTTSAAPETSPTAAPDAGRTVTEWYPVGRLVAIAGIVGGALASLSLLLLGTSVEAIHEKIRAILPAYIKQFSQLTPQQFDDAKLDQIANIAVYALPIASAVLCVMILVFNLWLAARITRASGRLRRPWPDLAALQIPPIIALGLALALFASLSSGMIGLMATAFAGALLFVYVCLGLAIIHYITRGNPYRSFILWAVYLALLFFNTYFLLAIAVFGLAEPISPLKRRFARPHAKHPGRGPPDNHPGSQPPPGNADGGGGGDDSGDDGSST